MTIAALTAALLAAALPASTARAAQAACSGRSANGGMVTRLRTFHVVAKPLRKTYRSGSVAKVEVTVTRPAHEDPLGNNIEFEPPTSLAAEGVNVSVGLYRGIFYMYGVGVTDSEGKAILKVKLHPNAPAGNVIGEAGARAYYNRGGCPDIEEEGFAYYPKFFKTTN